VQHSRLDPGLVDVEAGVNRTMPQEGSGRGQPGQACLAGNADVCDLSVTTEKWHVGNEQRGNGTYVVLVR
jgi:hypothetical protein